MFNVFKRLKKVEELSSTLENYSIDLALNIVKLETKLSALEDHFDLKFYHGDKKKPHYRKRKEQPKRPVGRPRKND
jgi:hypothetical protein